MTEHDLVMSLSSPVAAEAARLRRAVQRCEGVLALAEAWRDALAEDPESAASLYGPGSAEALSAMEILLRTALTEPRKENK